MQSTVADLEDEVADLEDELALHDHDGDYVVAEDEDLVMVCGRVNHDGEILHGEGFTVTRLERGKYSVQYDPGTFSDTPALVVDALGKDGGMLWIFRETKSGCELWSTLRTDQIFRLIAVGPQ